MRIVKSTRSYHSNRYGIVEVTPNEEEMDWTLDGLSMPLQFGSISLLNAIGDENDEPKDDEAERINDDIYYYDFEVDLYLAGAISENEFREFVLRRI
jgi:hypothetical protein